MENLYENGNLLGLSMFWFELCSCWLMLTDTTSDATSSRKQLRISWGGYKKTYCVRELVRGCSV